MSVIERVVLEGNNFSIKITANGSNDTEFSLDDNIDINSDEINEEAPLKGKMIFITGFRFVVSTGTIDYIKLDDNVVISGKNYNLGDGDSLYCDGLPFSLSSPSGNSPKLKDVLGNEFIVCRNKVNIKLSGDGASGYLLLNGFYIDNKF